MVFAANLTFSETGALCVPTVRGVNNSGVEVVPSHRQPTSIPVFCTKSPDATFFAHITYRNQVVVSRSSKREPQAAFEPSAFLDWTHKLGSSRTVVCFPNTIPGVQ